MRAGIVTQKESVGLDDLTGKGVGFVSALFVLGIGGTVVCKGLTQWRPRHIAILITMYPDIIVLQFWCFCEMFLPFPELRDAFVLGCAEIPVGHEQFFNVGGKTCVMPLVLEMLTVPHPIV